MRIIVKIEMKPGSPKKTQAAIFSDNKKNVGEKLKYQTPDLISKNMKKYYLANSRHEFLMKKNHFF